MSTPYDHGGPSYNIELYTSANKSLQKVDPSTRNMLTDEIMNLAGYQSPMESPQNVEKLATRGDLYRLRAGDYRVIFGIVTPYLVVLKVMERSDTTYNSSNMKQFDSLWKQALNIYQ